MSRRSRRTNRTLEKFSQLPYKQVKNPYKPLEVLTLEQVELIHRASMDILENIGLQVHDHSARQIYAEAGFDVEHDKQRVRFDRSGLMELIGKAPKTASLRGRDPTKRIVMGKGDMAFSSVGGPAFSSDIKGGRRAGCYEDMLKFIKLTQSLNIVHIEGGCPVDPIDLPPTTRHLDTYLASFLYVDKPWKPQCNDPGRARDALAMARIAFGEDDQALSDNPVFLANTNINTPLVFDADISLAVIEFARAGQPICITPFAMAGAMAPATIAGALALQNAETLAGGAFVQAINPGCPMLYGSFVCNADMRTGAPAFGTPETAKGAHASGQMARHYNLPWRSSNTNGSCAVDAQSAYESQMTLWSSITSHCSLLNHCAGWLEGGLVASFEKLIIDAEMLQMMAAWAEPPVVDDDTIGFDAIKEIGPGGHFLGCEHTMSRYQKAFYQPLVSDWSNYENWRDKGAKDTTQRAHELCQLMLDEYQKPDIDPAIEEALIDYVARRKEQISTQAAD